MDKVRDQLGHSTLAVTDRYVRWVGGSGHVAGRRAWTL